MRYALLIYSTEADAPAPDSPESQAVMQDYFAFTAMINERGVNLGGEALHDTSTATSVRVRNGEVLTTDGPFAETKEQFGGFYLIEAKDLDEALEIAAKCPGATHGTVEVRPVWEFDA